MRIHFTDADLCRTRLALDIDHMWEIVSSLQILQHRDGGLWFDTWRAEVRRRAAEDSRFHGVLRALVKIAPNARYFPDFLTPTEDDVDLPDAIDAMLSTPRARLRAELTRLDLSAPWPGLVDGTPAALHDLRMAVRVYYEVAVRPHLQRIHQALRVDTAGRVQTLLRRGPEAMLAGLAPMAKWQRPLLTCDFPYDRDCRLDGRGLRLIPSYFCVHHPVSLADRRLRPTLVYPIAPASRLLPSDHGRGDHLSALLGPTRARILRTVVTSMTTSSLARRTGVTPATISHHTTVLREAGVIATERHGTSADHLITSMGLRLLAGTE